MPEEEAQQAEKADLSNLVFLGGTRFSGAMDGAYSKAAIEGSVPNLMLQNGRFIPENTISVPYSNTSSGFNIYENFGLNGELGEYSLFYPNRDTTYFKRKIESGEPFSFSNSNTDIKSFTFPNLDLSDITSSNPSNVFLQNFYSTLSTSLIAEVIEANPTFFILDAGFDEIMNFSLNGAAGNPNVTDINTFSTNDLLSPQLFREQLEQLVAELLDAGPETKGVLLNIPNTLLKLPIFSKVYPNLKTYGSLSGDGAELSSQIQRFNQNLTEFYSENPNFPDEQKRSYFQFFGDVPFWGIIVADDALSDIEHDGYVFPKVRPAYTNEYLIYRNENEIKSGYGSNFNSPIPDTGFITYAEAELINERIVLYNQIIEDVVATSNGRLSLANVGGQLDNLVAGYDRELGNAPEGMTIDGVFYEPLISEFGMVSADGINLNIPGKAIFANTIIDAINTAFGGNLKKINPNVFAGTEFTLLQ